MTGGQGDGKGEERGEIPASFVRWFDGKDAEQLDTKEVEGRNYYPTTYKQRRESGAITEKPARLRILGVAERTKASLDALAEVAHMAGHKGPQLTREQAIGLVGPINFDNIEIGCLLALALREHEAPYGQMFLARILITTLAMPQIISLWDEHDRLAEREDPRIPTELDGDQFLTLARMVAEAGHLGPLRDIAGPVRTSFIVGLARRCASSATPPSSPAPLATST